MAKIDVTEVPACAHTALRRAARQLDIIYDEALAPTKLKMTQIHLLSRIDSLSHAGEAATLRALADDSAMRISALTHALRPLIRDGLIEVHTDERDRRVKHAVLTKLGRKQLHKGFLLWQTANRRVQSVLGAESAAQLLSLADAVSSKGFLRAYNNADSAD